MPHAGFVHLRVRSAFSLLQSTVQGRGPGRGVPGRADAGRGRHRRRQPVRGDAVRRRGQEGRRAADRGRHAAHGRPRRDGPPELQAASPPSISWSWSRTRQGYGNLLRLLSRAWVERRARGGDPRVALAELAAASAGLICLSGGPAGPVGAALRRGDAKLARGCSSSLQAAFGDRLYVELHAPRPAGGGRDRAGAARPRLRPRPAAGRDQRRPFPDADGYEAHDALVCIAEGAQVAQEERRRLTRRAPLQDRGRDGRAVRRPARGHRQHARRSPGAAPSWRRRASRSCPPSPRTRRPRCAGRPPRASSVGSRRRSGEPRWTSRRASEAARPYRERLAYELDVIAQMKFPGLLPDRLRLHQMGQGQRHAGRARARLGRRLGRRLEPRHHRPRPAPLRPSVRALPQPRARVDAGLRHRLLRGPARTRSSPMSATATAPTGWRRSSPSARCRRAPRCATSAACWPAVRAGRPHLQARPAQPGQPGHAGPGDRARAAAQGGARRRIPAWRG